MAIIWFSFTSLKKPIHIYLAGDSTMADKVKSARPEMGWGTRLHDFFDSTVVVINRAQNGRSTKTFIKEGIWQKIIDSAVKGDYVIIQFGHNDEVPTKASFTTQKDFTSNLISMVSQVRDKKAIPILITPVARRKFDLSGNVVDTHPVYARLVRNVAMSKNVTLVDLSKASQDLLQKFGTEDSKLLFNHLLPGQNPNYPEGKVDDTHLNELGARKMAQLVFGDLRKFFPDINERVVKSNFEK